MNFDLSLKFIDVSEQAQLASVRYTIRSQASSHGHAKRAVDRSRKSRKQAAWLGQADASQTHGELAGDTAIPRKGVDCGRQRNQEPKDQILRLIAPYNRPSFLHDQPWIDGALNEFFDTTFPRYWTSVEIHKKFALENIVNWFRLIGLNDPAIFCAMAGTAAFNTGCNRTHQSSYLRLQLCAVQQINLALSDATRRVNSLTILAVINMAAYELNIGNKTVAREAHIPGLRCMLAMKGGAEQYLADLPPFMSVMSVWLCERLAWVCGESEPILSWAQLTRATGIYAEPEDLAKCMDLGKCIDIVKDKTLD